MTQEKIFTFEELREAIGNADECHIYPYGYYDGETSEDPIACIQGAGETIDWIKEHPSYSEWDDVTGYLVVIINKAGSKWNFREVIF